MNRRQGSSLVLCLGVLIGFVLAPPPVLADVLVLDSALELDDVPSPERWKDIAANAFALSYRYGYFYDDAAVTITFDPLQPEPFAAHLSATNLKPNFAYQVKLEGKPTGLYGAEGDDITNEILGYAGRWWREQPNPGNADDADYAANHDEPGYIYIGYLMFDFFVTDHLGAAEVDLATDSSYHVLWWESQRVPGGCDSPILWSPVSGLASDPAYDANFDSGSIGVFAEIERGCEGGTVLPDGPYRCRFMLTEESFHQGGPPDARWIDVDGNHFTQAGGPFYYVGTNCYYLMVYAGDPSKVAYVDEVLEDARSLGLNVVRTWAFNDGADEWQALQTAPGVYDETVFQGLDYVLARAQQLGLHVILPFVNNWNDYGGMNQYAEWRNDAVPPPPPDDEFVTVNGTGFEIDGERWLFTGANFWSAMNLASEGPGGDRDRFDRELATLAATGVTSLTVMAGSEGPNSEPWRMVPALQTAPGVYDADLLDGLDYAVSAAKGQGMRLVMCLSNFWPWSGGLAQYVSWNGGGAIPYPPPEPGGDWNDFAFYTDDFYSNTAAMEDYRDFVAFLLSRVNPHTGVAYKDEPAILSWELANEPRGYENSTAFNLWLDATAAYIKTIDANHLVTSGCEGDTPWPAWNGLDFLANHDGPDIDYATIHIWPENWLWYDPADAAGTYASAEASARAYFNAHEAKANTLGKPLFLQEFGLGRDAGSYDPAATTTYRDDFYAAMYDEVMASMAGGGPCVAGQFWAWAGEGRPTPPHGSFWTPSDDWLGDPPHEPQGWYSVYDTDASTLSIVAAHSAAIQSLLATGGVYAHDDFYTDATMKQWYKDHVAAVVNRVNTVTGVAYRDDPTIMAWELANEPRCTSDQSGATLQAWIDEMSAYVKSLDSRHLVTVGLEGFYGPAGPAHNPRSWMGNQGTDFIPNHASADVDFATFHLYPDGIYYNITEAQTQTWIADHVDDSEALLGKPVILEEFGLFRPLDGPGGRDARYQAWYDLLYAKADAGLAAGGSNFWILYHDDYTDYDDFGVYYPGDASTVAIIQAEALRFRLLSNPLPNEGDWASVLTADELLFTLGAGGDDPPGPVTDLLATPGHERVLLSWVPPADGDLVAFEIFRGLWQDGGVSVYPEYDDVPGALPARPGSYAEALASGGWTHAGEVLGTATTFEDLQAARGFYAYEVFPRDLAGAHGPPAAAGDGATNYRLGDVALPFDGQVTAADLNTLGDGYARLDGEGGYDAELDVGPTDDESGQGLPLTDDAIQFEDLCIFALNYDGPGDVPRMAGEPERSELALRYELEQGSLALGDTLRLVLWLDEALDLRTVELWLDFDPAVLACLSGVPGDLFAAAGCPCFEDFDRIDSGACYAAAVNLGHDCWSTGPGELYRWEFQALAEGASEIATPLARLYPPGGGDPVEAALPAIRVLVGELTEALPGAVAAPRLALFPNPFNAQVRLALALPAAAEARLEVFDIGGRRVDRLWSGGGEATSVSLDWRGVGGDGQSLPSGVYLFVLSAEGHDPVVQRGILLK